MFDKFESGDKTIPYEGVDPQLERRIQNAKDMPASAHYIEAARMGAAEHPDHVIKAQGRAGERVALEDLGARGLKPEDLNVKGGNFPIYDVGSRDGVTSVKVHLPDDDQPEALNRQYAREFEESIGHGNGELEPILGEDHGEHLSPIKFNNAARHLHTMARSGADLPPELAKSEADAANYLREYGTLSIPSDHAQQLRGHLRERLTSTDAVTRQVQAERLGLNVSSPTYQADVEQLLNRIKGLPIKSDQLRQILTPCFAV